MAEFTAADLSVEDQYKLMSGAIIPRPIALTVTLGPDGPNAAPFSFFNCIGVSPPMFMIACSPKTGPKSGAARVCSRIRSPTCAITPRWSSTSSITSSATG